MHPAFVKENGDAKINKTISAKIQIQVKICFELNGLSKPFDRRTSPVQCPPCEIHGGESDIFVIVSLFYIKHFQKNWSKPQKNYILYFNK